MPRPKHEVEAELAALDIQILDDEFRRRAESDHMFFCRHVLGYQDLEDDLHGGLSEIVCDPELKLKKLLLLPRGHLKSSLITIGWSIWRIVQDPNRTIGLFNETQELVEAFLREIKDHLEGPVMQKYWPKLVPEEKNVWNKSAIILNRDIISRTPTIEAKSVEESTAGRHPDIMILDDPISDRGVRTEQGLQKSRQKFRELQALLEPPSKRDPVRGTMIVIGTRWHWQDLYSYIIEELDEFYDIHIRKAIEGGQCIFPKKFTHKVLREMRKTMGEWVFSSQMMNEPVDSEAAMFPYQLIKDRTWKGEKDKLVERIPCLTYLTVDPAWEGDDATGIVAAARAQNGKLYVLEAVRSKLKPDDMLNQVASMAHRWRVARIGFEGVVGGQEWLIKNLRDLLDELKISIPVVAMSHQNRSKDARIMGLQPELQYRRLYIHESCEALFTEFVQYPRSSFRDLLDATEMMVRIATPPGEQRQLKASRVPGTAEYEMAMMERRGKAARRRRFQAR